MTLSSPGSNRSIRGYGPGSTGAVACWGCITRPCAHAPRAPAANAALAAVISNIRRREMISELGMAALLRRTLRPRNAVACETHAILTTLWGQRSLQYIGSVLRCHQTLRSPP